MACYNKAENYYSKFKDLCPVIVMEEVALSVFFKQWHTPLTKIRWQLEMRN